MENVSSCPVCRSLNFSPFCRVRDTLVSSLEFGLSKCSDCTLIFTNPRPEQSEIAGYYASENYISHDEKPKGISGMAYRVVQKIMMRYKTLLIKNIIIGNISRRVPRILDYGCGTGEFLFFAKKHGWQVYGIEPNPNARQIAGRKGLRVYQSYEKLLEEQKGIMFDVITMWHVFEHVYHPNELIEKFAGQLSKNGIIVAAIPVHQSYDAEFYKEKWAAWDVPRHVLHFNNYSIKNLMKKQGFKLISTHPLFFDAYYISMKSMAKGLFGMNYILGLFVGMISNIVAFSGFRPYSSQIYFFRKQRVVS